MARNLPVGFELFREGRLWLVTRGDLAPALLPLLRSWAGGALPVGRAMVGGRGGVCAFDLAPDLAAVLRPCRRGGLLGRFNRSLHMGFAPRPFRELVVSDALRARGVPTVEMLGAAVWWVAPGLYRGAVASREAGGARNLWAYLCAVHPERRERACRLAAAATRRLHDAGALHPDLNLQNYLVCGDAEEVLVIDCDRVRLTPVSARDRQAAFDRLCRSVQRLDPEASVLTLACVEALHAVAQPATA